MRHAITVVLMLMMQTTVVFAACVTIDTSTWTVEQQQHLGGAAYFLATKAGHDFFPNVTGSTLCFSDPTFDPTMLTSTILAEATAEVAADQAAMTTQQIAQADLSTNQLQTIEPTQIDTVIDDLGFTTRQATFLKALVHYLVDMRVVGK